ncbi:MAG: ATP-binding protein [Candidatus Zixiibacteriota bacterium]
MYSNLNNQVRMTADKVFPLLESSELSFEMPLDVVAKIQNIADDNEYISDINLLLHDTVSGVDSLVHFGVTERGKIFLDSTRVPLRSILDILSASREKHLTTLGHDGRHIIYAIKPNNNAENYALIISAPNVVPKIAQNGRAYLLFVLFLISALISLLIINLIFKGIKRPLGELLDGFEKIASGQEAYLPVSGDKSIQGLIVGFNEMSQRLTENRKELASANERLMKANKSLIESESILTALVDYSPDAIIVTDLEDQVIIYNQAAAKDFGFNQSNMLGKKISNLIPVPNMEKSSADKADSLESQEVICRRQDGTKFPAVLVHTPLGPDGGRPMAMLYFVKSISESANYQDMILKLDRIASKGKMARDIAHEINNYLAILQGNLELIPMFMAKNDTEKVEKKLGVMKETVARIATFTDGLTRFSDENSEFTKEDLNQLVENLIAFLKPQNKFDNIFICTNLSENLPLVEIDASQVQHLLVHIITNAAEAMAKVEDNRWMVISTGADETENMAIIKIADGGPGVSSEHIGNLFIKRFSTKRDGTGLGLMTCKNIVDNHNGELSYHSGDDSKSIFEIKIPLSHISEAESANAGDDEKVDTVQIS